MAGGRGGFTGCSRAPGEEGGEVLEEVLGVVVEQGIISSAGSVLPAQNSGQSRSGQVVAGAAAWMSGAGFARRNVRAGGGHEVRFPRVRGAAPELALGAPLEAAGCHFGSARRKERGQEVEEV